MYPEENRAVFAANLKKLMDEKGVDRGDLARAVGVPYTTVNDWYNGATYPRIRNIEEIARFFKVTKSVLRSLETDCFTRFIHTADRPSAPAAPE